MAGKLLGVYIHEFSIGFGPKIFSKQSDETKFSWRIIPLGGFVRFAGEEAVSYTHLDVYKRQIEIRTPWALKTWKYSLDKKVYAR